MRLTLTFWLLRPSHLTQTNHPLPGVCSVATSCELVARVRVSSHACVYGIQSRARSYFFFTPLSVGVREHSRRPPGLELGANRAVALKRTIALPPLSSASTLTPLFSHDALYIRLLSFSLPAFTAFNQAGIAELVIIWLKCAGMRRRRAGLISWSMCLDLRMQTSMLLLPSFLLSACTLPL